MLRDAPLHEQVAHFEAMLPGDLIGKHAVAHIRWALEWELHRDTVGRYWGPPPGPSREERRDQVIDDVRLILEAGRHSELNGRLRVAHARGEQVDRWGRPTPSPDHLLLGMHDVEEFAEDIASHVWVCEVVRTVAEDAR